MTENPARQGDQPPPPPGGAGPGTLPGPGLAQALAAAAGGDGAGLGSLSDSELVEMITGGRQMSSWSAWVELAAMAEYAARHPAPKGDPGPFARGAADEVGFAARMTWTSAADRMAFAASAATRLPATFAALREGKIDPVLGRDPEIRQRYPPPRPLGFIAFHSVPSNRITVSDERLNWVTFLRGG